MSENDKTTTALLEEKQSLETAVANITIRVSGLETEAQLLRRDLLRKSERINAIQAEVRKRTEPAKEPKITDHALLRYIERAYDIDMDALRDHIMTEQITNAIKAGASSVTVDGIKFFVKDNVVTTVMDRPDPRIRKVPRERTKSEPTVKSGLEEYYNREEP